MTMKPTILILSGIIFFLHPHAYAATKETSKQASSFAIELSKDKSLQKQWNEVKKKYPGVAMQLLRREAFMQQLVGLSISRAISQEHASTAINLCYLYARLDMALPSECSLLNYRIGDIGSCFEPQPSSSGGYEDPSVEDAEACVQREIGPQ